MKRLLSITSLTMLLCGLGNNGLVSLASAQDVVANVDIANKNPFPIRVKRIGLEDDDQEVLEIRANGSASFENISFNSDQVFVAFKLDGSKKGIGSHTVGAQAANAGVTLNVSSGIAPAQKGPTGNSNMRAEAFATNLGIYYRQIRKNDGTFVAEITRNPAAGTPAAEVGFERGDIILALDEQAFRKPQDVLEHTKETTVDFIDVRTKERKRATVVLP